MALEVIILAAGHGKRMQSELPKVLHQVGGKAMLQHVVEASINLKPNIIHIVVGSGREIIRQSLESMLGQHAVTINWVVQNQQLGTGHAVSQAIPALDASSTCLILYGDVPLVDGEALAQLVKSKAPLALLTGKPDNTFGLGRIVRDDSNRILGIVEHKDATPAQLEIPEINTGIMLAQTTAITRWLNEIGNNNSQGEYYLTDIVARAVHEDAIVDTVFADRPDLLLGVNSKSDLAVAERSYQLHQAQYLMQSGVTLMDPARLDIRGNVSIGSDCCIDVNVVLEGVVVIGSHSTIGPNCVIRNARIGDHCQINENSVVEQSVIGNHCRVGPFARLRPETELHDQVGVGNFVEIKKTQVGKGSKINHLAYVGDSTIGKNVNVGAGVITCNYDGANKHQTIIGDHVFVGSDSQLIAPIRIGEGATVGAGSTVTQDVDAGALVVSRARQKAVAGWQRPSKKQSVKSNKE